MTTIHTTRGRATGTCMLCGGNLPDDKLAFYSSTNPTEGYLLICEPCHDARGVTVQFWELVKLSELRSGTAFPSWWKHLGVYYSIRRRSE